MLEAVNKKIVEGSDQPGSKRRTVDWATRLSKSQSEEVRRLRVQCGQLCVAAFVDERSAVRSVGFTSAIDGEGKSFVARLAAVVTARDHALPVTLLECNWERRCFEEVFELDAGPGLAEWVRGECDLEAIRQPVSDNLTVIRAGDDKGEMMGLLRQLRQRGVVDVLERAGEVLIADLPSIVSTTYGRLAASVVESLVVVVRMGYTEQGDVAETCTRLKDLHVQGVVLNRVNSRIPRWLGPIS